MGENMAGAKERKGTIASVSLLDLRHMQSIDELSDITGIFSVGTILLSDNFKGTIASIPMKSVGGVITVPTDRNVNIIQGTMKMTGEFMANISGNGSELLLVAGDLIITSPIEKFGYESLIVSGDLFVPKGSEKVLAPFIRQITGQIFYIDHGNVRLFQGQDRFGKDFFSYIKEPMTMILMGEFLIEADVSAELLQERVSQIVLMGVLKAEDKQLVPLLLALAEDKMGQIIVGDTLEGEHR